MQNSNLIKKTVVVSAGIGSSLPAHELSRALKVATKVLTYRIGEDNSKLPNDKKFITDFCVTEWHVERSTDEDEVLASGPEKTGTRHCFDIKANIELSTNLTDEEIGRSLEIDFRSDADMREIEEIFDYQSVLVGGNLYTCTGDVISQ